MKVIIRVILIFLLSCTFPLFGQDETAGKREYYDSANFNVIIGRYVSGELFLKSYGNKLTKLDSWEQYYKNGQLKKIGTMTTGNHIYVGIWKYYSQSGKLDSVVNYNKKFRISYFEAIKIAKKNGFEMPEMEIEETIYKGKSCWEISRWTENEDHTGQTAEFILIDKKTGKVIKPNDIIKIGIY